MWKVLDMLYLYSQLKDSLTSALEIMDESEF